MKRLQSIIKERFDSVGYEIPRLIGSHQHHRLGKHGARTCLDVLIEEIKSLPEVCESQSESISSPWMILGFASGYQFIPSLLVDGPTSLRV
jgi:hypothetical protein